jgi:hypothetical protein
MLFKMADLGLLAGWEIIAGELPEKDALGMCHISAISMLSAIPSGKEQATDCAHVVSSNCVISMCRPKRKTELLRSTHCVRQRIVEQKPRKGYGKPDRRIQG